MFHAHSDDGSGSILSKRPGLVSIYTNNGNARVNYINTEGYFIIVKMKL